MANELKNGIESMINDVNKVEGVETPKPQPQRDNYDVKQVGEYMHEITDKTTGKKLTRKDPLSGKDTTFFTKEGAEEHINSLIAPKPTETQQPKPQIKSEDEIWDSFNKGEIDEPTRNRQLSERTKQIVEEPKDPSLRERFNKYMKEGIAGGNDIDYWNKEIGDIESQMKFKDKSEQDKWTNMLSSYKGEPEFGELSDEILKRSEQPQERDFNEPVVDTRQEEDFNDIFDDDYQRSWGIPRFQDENDVEKLKGIYQKAVKLGDEGIKDSVLERLDELGVNVEEQPQENDFVLDEEKPDAEQLSRLNPSIETVEKLLNDAKTKKLDIFDKQRMIKSLQGLIDMLND